jgi:hypothetical protein
MTDYSKTQSFELRRLIRKKVRYYKMLEGKDTDMVRKARGDLKKQINEISAILASREAQLFLL